MLTEIEKHILSHLHVEEMAGFLKKLVQSNSENPPGREKQTALLIGEFLQSFGCTVNLQYVEPDRPNIIGVLEGKSPEKILFNGHTDTVKAGDAKNWTVDPFGCEIKDGYLYGRGACDMKAGIVSMIFAMKALKLSGIPFHKGIMFTGVIDEEVGFKGTKALIQDKLINECSVGFVSEPTGLNIVTQHKGAIEYKATVYGKSAHTGQALQGQNAIVGMATFITALERYNNQLAVRKKHPVFGHSTVNIGTINGGTGVTFVPDRCEIEFDRQILPGEELADVHQEIVAVAAQVKHDHRINLDLVLVQQFSSWQISPAHPVARWMGGAFEKALGRKAETSGFNAYCEVEMLTKAGIPSLVFGPGSIDDAHRPDERVLLQDVLEAAKVYALCGYQFVSQPV